jgi:hypothetical protein
MNTFTYMVSSSYLQSNPSVHSLQVKGWGFFIIKIFIYNFKFGTFNMVYFFNILPHFLKKILFIFWMMLCWNGNVSMTQKKYIYKLHVDGSPMIQSIFCSFCILVHLGVGTRVRFIYLWIIQLFFNLFFFWIIYVTIVVWAYY